MARTFNDALDILKGMVRVRTSLRSNKTDVPAIEIKAGIASPARGVPALRGMRYWLETLGYDVTVDMQRMNIIHVAGTNGKGSTCAFSSSFLCSHGERTGFPRKVGSYFSPQLINIRERIQINQRPLSEISFAKYFFEVYDCIAARPPPPDVGGRQLPRYLQILFIVAFHAFVQEGVDVAVFETHNGGEFDSTNVIVHPAATAITSLGLDHVEVLGPTLSDIARHKAGIFKQGSPAFSVRQDAVAEEALIVRAGEKDVDLTFLDIDPSLLESTYPIFEAAIQRVNCSLAMAAVRALLRDRSPNETDPSLTQNDINKGIKNFSWPGRFETIIKGDSYWFVDCAHNEHAIVPTTRWFAKQSLKLGSTTPNLLIARVSGDKAYAILTSLANTMKEFDMSMQYVIFTTHQAMIDPKGKTPNQTPNVKELSDKPDPQISALCSAIWSELDASSIVSTELSIGAALNAAKRISKNHGGMKALVTGSCSIAGPALDLLRPSGYFT